MIFPGGTSGKEPTCQCKRDVRHVNSIPQLGRSHGGGHGSSLQCPCLKNPMDREAWQATVHRVIKSQTRLKRLSMQKDLKKLKDIPFFGLEELTLLKWQYYQSILLKFSIISKILSLVRYHSSDIFFLI